MGKMNYFKFFSFCISALGGIIPTNQNGAFDLSTNQNDANVTVVVLGQYFLDWKVPLVINIDGTNSEINFELDDSSSIWEACSVDYQGQYYLFGGRFHKRQISKVDNCGLRHVGSLNFDFNTGSCGSFD